MQNLGYEKSCFESISSVCRVCLCKQIVTTFVSMQNFQKYRSEVKQIDATKLMEEMRKDLINMLNWKKDAVERIANKSENIASQYVYSKFVV